MTDFIQVLVLGLLAGGLYALAASGLTLVFGVMNVINVAHGALLVLGAYLTWLLWRRTGADPVLLILVTTPAMFVVGWVGYKLFVQRVRGAPAMSVLLTFSLALVIQGILGEIWSNDFRTVITSYSNRSFHIGSIVLPKERVIACAMAVVILGLLWLMLTRTWLGRAIRASAENPQGAALVGIELGSVAALTFAIGVATTGAGGSLISFSSFFPSTHYLWISRLLGIIVLGGMGSLSGAFVGALLMGVGEAMVARYVPNGLAWVTAVPYMVIFVVLLVRPRGIFGAATREDVATI